MESSIQSTNGVQQAAYTPHLIPTDQKLDAIAERASAAPLQGVDSEVDTQPALSTAPVDCQVLSHTYTSAGESALFCFQSGHRVVPFDPASKCPAMGFGEWLDGLSEEKVISHWGQYPDHEVGCIVDADSIVFSVEGQKASAAICEIESAHRVVPNMVVTATTGALHFVRCAKGTSAAPDSHGTDKQSGRIVVRTEDKLVMLPSCADYRLSRSQADGASDSTEVSQAFIDAVLHYNASLTDVPADADAEMVAPIATPAAARPTFSTTGPVEVGESGKGEFQGAPDPISPAFLPVSDFGGPRLENVSPDADLLAAVGSTFSAAVRNKVGEAVEAGVHTDQTPIGIPSSNLSDISGFAPPSLQNVSPDSDPRAATTGTDIPTAFACVPSEVGKSVEVADVWDPDANFIAAGEDADNVLTPKAAENPVISALKERGRYKTPLGSGKHSISCPWLHEHADAQDSGTEYLEPGEDLPLGGFSCANSHREKHDMASLLDFLEIADLQAKNKPEIRIVAGDLHRVVHAAEKELAKRGRHYQTGGLIVSVVTDPTTGDPSIIPTSTQALTKELSVAASWLKFDKRTGHWEPSDPPQRHVGILNDGPPYYHLAPLAGVARQPYFREEDGILVREPGYDSISRRFGVFDPRQFEISETTREAAMSALGVLQDLIAEFHYKTETDRAASLSGIFTAVVRPTLAHAPAYHMMAAILGSGKTHLCEVTGSFAGPAGNSKVSYPTTSEEATKAMLSLLLTNPAVIEFDDMDGDWIPHGVIKRMLTAEHIRDRILGVSKTATVSTRTLFLGSGNNVGPIRDLLRRVITIHLDPRCATPALITYKNRPLEMLRKNRGAYVAAVLTIILAWREAGSPRTDVPSIATYGGAWSDYCRHPLIWLGLPDPATALLEQIKHDPDGDSLLELLTAWHSVFGSKPTTVGKVVEATARHADLLDAIREFPVEDRGVINKFKLGWQLKKMSNRIVGCYELRRTVVDGKTAWEVVVVGSTPFSPFTPSASVPGKTVAPTSRARKDFDPLDDY